MSKELKKKLLLKQIDNLYNAIVEDNTKQAAIILESLKTSISEG